jgi:predicted Zn-dependent peptidase
MRIGLCVSIVLFAASACKVAPSSLTRVSSAGVSFPIVYEKLKNGLRVVYSEDRSAPTVVVAVYYKIGFRIEPRNRTGFAHLFEHMMFQGSRNLGKMEFIRLIQSSGGLLNGSTRFDFTNYFQVLPSNKLETALWAEADRMAGLDVTQENLINQQKVVKNEVRVNVLNRPYGGFPWLDLPQRANENWYNAHNFYGDLKDLDAATLDDVRKFFETYYVPNNAVVVLVGDFDTERVRPLVDRYFGKIAPGAVPALPDVSEPRQTEEKHGGRVDAKAPRPALAVGYHMPARGTPEHYAFCLLDQILLRGEDAYLYDELVQKGALTGEVSGGMNLLGNPFNYQGPMLWTLSMFHDKSVRKEALVAAVDRAIARVREKPLPKNVLERALVKMRSAHYDVLSRLSGFGRADLLASFALFDDDPSLLNQIEPRLRAVTPELLWRTATEYLRPTNRTWVAIETQGAKATGGAR